MRIVTAHKRSRAMLAIAGVALLLAALLAVAGCSSSSGSGSKSSASGSASASSASASGSSAASGEMRSFTDSLGRTVEIPANVERIAVSGPTTQQVILTIAPEKLVGLSNELDRGETKYHGASVADLPVFGQIYGGKGNFNKEAVAAADPQLVVDVGEGKKSIAEDLDEIQESIGIPCVHIEATIDTYDQAYTMLGELLGVEDRAAELSAYCKDAWESTQAGLAKVPDDQKVKALYLLGGDGLNAMAKDSFQAQVFNMCTDNLAVIDNPGGSGLGSEVSFEQIALWDPELIVFGDGGTGSMYSNVAADETWQSLPAIANGNYLEVPHTPYNWISSPPGINMVIGTQWLPRVLYPDAFSDDAKTVVVNYFKTMYGYELTDNEYAELTANAQPKAQS